MNSLKILSRNMTHWLKTVATSLTCFFDRTFIHASRKTRVITFSALFLTVFTFGAAGVAPDVPDVSDVPIKHIVESLTIPALDEQLQAVAERNERYMYEEKVRPGDTLASLLQRLGVDDAAANRFIQSDKIARSVMRQKAGRTVRAQTNDQGELLWLQTHLVDSVDAGQISNITISRHDGVDTFSAAEVKLPLERRLEMKSGEITSSLFKATDTAQVPDAIASQMVEMFSTDIDFGSDIKRGDHFQLLYETFWQNGEMVKTGKVLAGQFTNDGRLYQEVWYVDPKGVGSYYSFNGKANKKGYLKSPIAFTRISSGFSMRVHPLSGKWHQHTGVDFPAPIGTPIHAAADGVIESASRSGGYGNLVVVKHGKIYSTAYAHMSRFAPNLRKGMKVKQGEVIGYVGATGWATAPHLHYEFRVNNKAQDPLKIKVEQSNTLAGTDLTRFKSVVDDVRHRFALLRPQESSSPIASQVASR